MIIYINYRLANIYYKENEIIKYWPMCLLICIIFYISSKPSSSWNLMIERLGCVRGPQIQEGAQSVTAARLPKRLSLLDLQVVSRKSSGEGFPLSGEWSWWMQVLRLEMTVA